MWRVLWLTASPGVWVAMNASASHNAQHCPEQLQLTWLSIVVGVYKIYCSNIDCPIIREVYRSPKNKNKNQNNFILHQIFKITNNSCQLFIDETIALQWRVTPPPLKGYVLYTQFNIDNYWLSLGALQFGWILEEVARFCQTLARWGEGQEGVMARFVWSKTQTLEAFGRGGGGFGYAKYVDTKIIIFFIILTKCRK